MADKLVLTVVISGSNVMGNPLMRAEGVAIIQGRKREISINTPITSIPDFVESFTALFQPSVAAPEKEKEKPHET